jgi:ATP-dependent RNA helicase RhlE
VSAAHRATILVATPGRLLDHLKQGSFRLDKVEQLVLDEADRMLDMGFLPDIKAVLSQLPKERQTQLFSATLAPEVERIASFAMKNPQRVEISKPTTVAEGISQILYPVVQSQKAGLLLELLKSTEMKSVLVFSRTKHGADKLAKRLQAEGYGVGVLHGNRSQNQRTSAMEAFRHGRIRMLVATDIAARGIDVKGISHVVNFDVPRFPEDYVHRVGRTARAYGVGDAITFMDPSTETSCVRDIERFVGITFPRAVLPTFQYNAPPKEAASDRRPQENRGGRGGGRPQQHGRPQQGGPQRGPRNDGNRGRDNRGQRPARDGQGQGQNRPFNGNRRPDGPRQDGGNRFDNRKRDFPRGERNGNANGAPPREKDGNRREAPRQEEKRPFWDRPSRPPTDPSRRPKGYW